MTRLIETLVSRADTKIEVIVDLGDRPAGYTRPRLQGLGRGKSPKLGLS